MFSKLKFSKKIELKIKNIITNLNPFILYLFVR